MAPVYDPALDEHPWQSARLREAAGADSYFVDAYRAYVAARAAFTETGDDTAAFQQAPRHVEAAATRLAIALVGAHLRTGLDPLIALLAIESGNVAELKLIRALRVTLDRLAIVYHVDLQ